MQVQIPCDVQSAIARCLRDVLSVQTHPYELLVEDYRATQQQVLELQVRSAQLDKEAAELRDENVSLHRRLVAMDEAKAQEWRQQAEAARLQVKGLRRELDVATKECELLRAQVTRLTTEQHSLQEQHNTTLKDLEQVKQEASSLKDALTQTTQSLEHERESRIAAASEVQASLETKESAVQEAEKLRSEVQFLTRKLVELKEREMERMDEINKMHEEMLFQAANVRKEAESEREAAALIRDKAGQIAAATLQAAAAAASAVGIHPNQPMTASGILKSETSISRSASQQGDTAQGQSMQKDKSSFSWSQSLPFGVGKTSFVAPTVLGRMFGLPTATSTTSQDPGQSQSQHRTSAGGGSNADGDIPHPLSDFQGSSVERNMASTSVGRASGSTSGAPGPISQAGGSKQDPARTSSSITDDSTEWNVVMPALPSGGAPPVLQSVGLQELMNMKTATLGNVGNATCDAERSIPRAPYRTFVAHRGGAAALAIQPTGHLMVSCGADSSVGVWDLTVMRSGAGPHQSLRGMAGGVNDVAWLADGSMALGAGADKSLHLWDHQTGHTRHTLTGHSAAVTCCAASPLDSRAAVSISDDRSMRIWDLGKGFGVSSISCAKMPNALTMSGDGNTVVTGHVDGSLSLWDMRQAGAGNAKPLAETKVTTSLVTGLAATPSDSLLLVAGKEGHLLVWDFRMQSTVTSLKAPRFMPGTYGSMGRGRCHPSLSSDQRWVAAGGSDGSVYIWDMVTPGYASTATAATGSGGPGRKLSSLLLSQASPRSSSAGGGGGVSGKAPGSVLHVRPYHKDAIVATAWSNDSTVLITADKAGVVSFWSLTG